MGFGSKITLQGCGTNMNTVGNKKSGQFIPTEQALDDVVVAR
jgi:hypothetical protein